MKEIYLFAFCLTMFLAVCHGEFLGGTISWKMIPNKNNVRLTYRLSWEKGTGPCSSSCTPVDIGKTGNVSGPELSTVKWISVIGNVTKTISDANYLMTSVSVRNDTGWEQGEGVLQVNGPFSQSFIIALLKFPWISSRNKVSFLNRGYMETFIDTRKRNDTGQPNGSLYTALPSYIGVPYGCTSEVKLPVEDPDEDRIRCRLAESSECGGACTNLPLDSLWVYKTNCAVKIQAFKSTGYTKDSIYRLTLVAEDFPRSTLTLGSDIYTRKNSLSRVPIQITIRVLDAPCNQQSRLTYVKPTLPNFSRSSFGLRSVINRVPVATNFYLKATDNFDINATEIIMSSPMYLNYTYFSDDQSVTLNRSNVMRVGVIWRPRFPIQIGYQQFCVWGVDTYGVTTDARCMTSIVGDDGDFCYKGTVTCEHNGTCVNVFKNPHEKCICRPEYHSKDCSEVMRCYENPCENNSTCIDSKTGFRCQCQHGYTGVMCETQLFPYWSSPCLNHGICISVKDGFTCLCSENYTGKYCEDAVKDNSKDNLLTYIIPIAVGGVMAMSLVVTSFLIIKGACKTPLGTQGKIKPKNETKQTTPEVLSEW